MTAKTHSVKLNYFLNVARLLLNVIVLAVSMPYVSRVLGSSGIGRVEYAYAVLEYFLIFSALGIPIYGIRQIARFRDDITERSRITIELAIVLLITTAIAYCCYFVLLYTAPFEYGLRDVLLVLSFGILLSNFNLEWFYQGMENQLYITVRQVFVKVGALVFLFLTVKTTQDIYYYAAFLIISMFGGSVFNIAYIRKHVLFNKEVFNGLNIRRHLKPSLTILMASAAVSIYMQLDKLMLGTMVSDAAVGYYAQAIKLPRQAMLIITSFGAVMLPRLSHLLHNNGDTQYYAYLGRSLNYICFVAVPLCIVFLVLSEPIILVMAGKGFIPSITTLQLSAPLILIVSLAYFTGFMVLYPSGNEKTYTIAVCCAAAINLVFNLYAIPLFKQDGAALGTLVAEITGLGIMITVARKALVKAGFFASDKIKYIVAGVIMGAVMYLCTFMPLMPLLQILVAGSIGALVYLLVLYTLKDKVIEEIYHMIAARLKPGQAV